MLSLKGFLESLLVPCQGTSGAQPGECIPVGIEHSGSVSAKQRDLVGKFSSLIQRDNSECAATGGIPID
jgi:hypothetical protein